MSDAPHSDLLRRFERSVGWVACVGGLVGGLSLALLLVDREASLVVMLVALAILNASLLLGVIYGTTWAAVSAGVAVQSSVREVQEVRRRRSLPEAGQLALGEDEETDGALALADQDAGELSIAEPSVDAEPAAALRSHAARPSETPHASA